MRYLFLKNCCSRVGDNVSIQPGAYLFNTHNLEIGDDVIIHPMCYIEAAGVVRIGSNVSIAHSSSLISTNHTWDDASIHIKYNRETLDSITIEDDVWVGCGVRILSGITIKKRSIVAAGAVVNKTLESNSLLAGIPARLIKKINEA